MKFQYDRRQLRAMCFVASLAPVTRLLPKAAAQLAGSASWLAPLCALPPLLLFLLILTSLMKMRREGEGLGEVIMRRSGRTAGAIGLALIGSFTLFSAGFILRTGAHRLISTIYPDARAAVFSDSDAHHRNGGRARPCQGPARGPRAFSRRCCCRSSCWRLYFRSARSMCETCFR